MLQSVCENIIFLRELRDDHFFELLHPRSIRVSKYSGSVPAPSKNPLLHLLRAFAPAPLQNSDI